MYTDKWTTRGPIAGRYYHLTNKDIEQIIGLAVRKVDGVKDLKASFTDVFKNEEDWSRGVTAYIDADGGVTARTRIIVEKGHDPATVINEATRVITRVIEDEAGKTPNTVSVAIASFQKPLHTSPSGSTQVA